MNAATLRRLAGMDPAELRFRARVEGRKTLGRLRHRIAPPRWRRADLTTVIDVDAVRGLADALGRRDFMSAHRALAAHLTSRTSCWPLHASERSRLRASVVDAFPDSPFEAAERAEPILDGRYDLLGYRALRFGAPTDWHLDPVHGRRAPGGFWASIPYLDPACGDHKITWELNRHQQWLALGRAYWLTGDARYRKACLSQLAHWLTANPPLDGVNWASMLELAFRSISWTYAVEFFVADTADDDEPWLVDLFIALDRQLAHVEQNLSRYFSPNTHLTGEALALYAVSRAFPELRASAHRAGVGRDILAAEASRQIRADGGHAELSAHYHRYSTDFYLLATMVARESGDPAASRFEAAARAQADYLRTIADDRGALPLIGDDDGGQLFAFGISRPADAAPTLAAAADVLDDAPLATANRAPEATFWILGREPRLSIRLAHHDPWRSRWLRDSGYFVSRTAGGHLVFDAGPHGFLNGGHAHADALQVTLSAGGRPVLVDPGTASYTADPAARDRFRSARMHNTVVIDGKEHARPKGPFHWETFADARFTAAETGAGFDFAQGSHDGHAALRHVRSVAALEGFGWLIVDQVLGGGEHELEAWWHVHPALTALRDRQAVRLESDAGLAVILVPSDGQTDVLEDHPLSVYAPEYGCVQPAPAIRVCRRGTAPFALATFVALPQYGGVEVGVRESPLSGAPTAGFDGRAFTVRLGADRLTVLVAAPLNGQAQPWPRAAAWGTATVRSDARFAVVLTRAGATSAVAAVDGTAKNGNAAARPGMASAVHG